jgi:hypothetical protein
MYVSFISLVCGLTALFYNVERETLISQAVLLSDLVYMRPSNWLVPFAKSDCQCINGIF